MSYNSSLPADTSAPEEIRENFRALKEDKIVAAASATTADSATTAESCTGNAATATKLATAVNINGVSFDGSADITITQVDGKAIATTDQIIASSVPVGVYIEYAGSSAPDGYLLCDGSAVSRSTYAELYAVIGTTYGSGDESTTFNLPDSRDRFALAKGTTYPMLGATGGEATHALTISEVPSHRHFNVVSSANNQSSPTTTNSIPRVNGYNGCHEQAVMCGDSGEPDVSRSSATGESSVHNNMPPYMVVNVCIKY